MKDNLLIASKYKKTIEYILKITDNFPNKELELKSRIVNNSFDILENIYLANYDKNAKKILISKIKMLDYYLKLSYEKEIISKMKYEVSSNHLLELIKMITGWFQVEKS